MRQLILAIILAAAAAVLVAQEPPSPLEKIRAGLSVAIERVDKLIADARKQQPPPPAPVIVVKAGDSLQAAIDAAKPGDTLALEAGATFRGNFTLPKKDGTGVITITSAAADKLPAGVRVKPSDVAAMANIVSPNTGAAMETKAGAHDWKLVGLHVSAPGYYSGGLLRLGDGRETTLENLPKNITVERCYIHGDPKMGGKRGVNGNASGFVLRDSHVSDIKSDGQDTQAFHCSSCDHVLVENNYLEASGENAFISEVGLIPGYIPFDVEIRRNWIRKPLLWMDGTDVSPSGKKWVVKNLFELKAGKNVRLHSNVLENSWPSAQIGTMINLKPGIAATVNAAITEDVLIENNLLSGGLLGIVFSGTDTQNMDIGVGTLKRVTVRNNVWLHVGGAPYGTNSRLMQFAMSPTEGVTIERNTFLGEAVNMAMALDGIASPGFVFRDNLLVHGTYGAKGPSLATGAASINVQFPGAIWESNAFIHPTDMSAKYPAGTRFVTSVDFAPDGYTQIALPGVGVDAAKLNAAIAGVKQ